MKESITEYDKLLEKNKNNIIDWYPFEENSTILQFILDEKIEELKINQNTKKVTKIEEITEQEKYDYIILIGNINKIENDFSKLVNLLNENGKILIITDNKLSVKSMCQQLNTEQLYTRKEIENLLEKEKLIYQKYYYVYPSYRTTNVIFTDKHLPDIDTISRNITFYPEDTVISTLENEKMSQKYISVLEYESVLSILNISAVKKQIISTSKIDFFRSRCNNDKLKNLVNLIMKYI